MGQPPPVVSRRGSGYWPMTALQPASQTRGVGSASARILMSTPMTVATAATQTATWKMALTPLAPPLPSSATASSETRPRMPSRPMLPNMAISRRAWKTRLGTFRPTAMRSAFKAKTTNATTRIAWGIVSMRSVTKIPKSTRRSLRWPGRRPNGTAAALEHCCDGRPWSLSSNSRQGAAEVARPAEPTLAVAARPP